MTPIAHQHDLVPVSDGTTMDLYVARPADGTNRQAGVIVLQEIFGVNGHIRDVTDRFARHGYTAAAPDIFHRTAPRFDVGYDDRSGMAHAQALTAEQAAADIRAAHQHLRSLLAALVDDPKIAAVGFCLGGGLAFLANAELPLAAAVSFYGAGIARAHIGRTKDQHGPLLLFWGGKDQHITTANRREVADALTAAGKPFINVEVGHADHGFFCDARGAYEPVAARQAWDLTTSFLDSHLAT